MVYAAFNPADAPLEDKFVLIDSHRCPVFSSQDGTLYFYCPTAITRSTQLVNTDNERINADGTPYTGKPRRRSAKKTSAPRDAAPKHDSAPKRTVEDLTTVEGSFYRIAGELVPCLVDSEGVKFFVHPKTEKVVRARFQPYMVDGVKMPRRNTATKNLEELTLASGKQYRVHGTVVDCYVDEEGKNYFVNPSTSRVTLARYGPNIIDGVEHEIVKN